MPTERGLSYLKLTIITFTNFQFIKKIIVSLFQDFALFSPFPSKKEFSIKEVHAVTLKMNLFSTHLSYTRI